MEFWKGYDSDAARFEQYCKDYLEKNLPYSKLGEAVKYAFFNGGKRLRPLMLLAVCEAQGQSGEEALRAALALELIHCYSLVHDDLPCMDDDDFRRGNLSTHKKFGEAFGVLCGDAMLNLAYEVILDDVSAMSQINAAKIIAYFAGVSGMVGGQEMDIAKNPPQDSEQYLFQMYLKKTGALFRAAAGAGAALGGCALDEAETLDLFAKNFGLGYQLADDLQDQKDEEGKLTFIKLMDVQKTTDLANRCFSEAQKALEPYGKKYQKLIDLCSALKSVIRG